MLSEAELIRRRPVWEALSALWLDTQLSDEDLRWIAAVLRASSYSIAELRQIYLKEVAPVVSLNLLSVAGVWAGFNPAWLSEEAAKRAATRAPAWDSRWNLLQCIRTYATEPDLLPKNWPILN